MKRKIHMLSEARGRNELKCNYFIASGRYFGSKQTADGDLQVLCSVGFSVQAHF